MNLQQSILKNDNYLSLIANLLVLISLIGVLFLFTFFSNQRIDSNVNLAYTANHQANQPTIETDDNLINKETKKLLNTVFLIQIIGILIIFLYAIVFFVFFIKKLKKYDNQINQTNKELEDTMHMVNQSLFVIDKNLNITKEYSNLLFKEDKNSLLNKNLIDILKNHVSDKDLNAIKEFVDYLYSFNHDLGLSNEFNSLNKILFSEGKGLGVNKYLNIQFHRIHNTKDMGNIMVSINDISDMVYLEQSIEYQEIDGVYKNEIISAIANNNSSDVGYFFDEIHAYIDKVNNSLKNTKDANHLNNELDALYQHTIMLKEKSIFFRLHGIKHILSKKEKYLQDIRSKDVLSGSDFLPLVSYMDDLIEYLNCAKNAYKNHNGYMASNQYHSYSSSLSYHDDNYFLSKITKIDDEFCNYLLNFGNYISSQQDKRVKITIVSDVDEDVLSETFFAIKEMSVQLLSNAITHGMMDGQYRANHKKYPIGNVFIHFEKIIAEGQDYLSILVEDDGQGIDFELIRKKLVEDGYYALEEINHMSQSQLFNTLFLTGFSTKETISEYGGYGMGLSIVKNYIRKLNGKISVQSELGNFTRFIVKIPLS